MKRNRVLLVYKKTSYQKHALDHKERPFLELMRKKTVAARYFRETHEEHIRVLEEIKGALKKLKLPYDVRLRYRLQRPLSHYALVITIGGDGTFLETARHAKKEALLLGINSTPKVSVGFFCHAGPSDFVPKIKKALAGKARIQKLHRLQVRVNGKLIRATVLNDILFTNYNPADTSRYLLSVRGQSEEQKSSGIWFSTAAGSTAAIHSAGSAPIPVGSPKFLYRVREPYCQKRMKYKLCHGTLSPTEKIRFINYTNHMALYIDGPHVVIPLKRGDQITVERSSQPVRVVWT
ncbi:MAG: hypothetical protein Q7S00_04190 [bacterium]|nr:hypothetical protein [bacterium]